MLSAAIAFPDLLAYTGAGVTVIGGIVGVIFGEATRSRRTLEDLALGAAVGGFLGCFIAIIAYLFTSRIVS